MERYPAFSHLPFPGCSLVALLASLLLLTACSRKPAAPPTEADLHFPVVVLYTNASTLLFKDAAGLHTMHTNVVVMLNEPPVLIDSHLNLFTVERLQSTHGGLWLMAHPVGLTEVQFTLTRSQKSGLEAARVAMLAQLDRETWLPDPGPRRALLAKQTTLQGMLSALVDESDR